MTWEEFMGPLMVQFVAPLAITLAGGAITYIVAEVGGAARKYLNVDIDSKLNALLHAALQRAVAAALAKYGGLPVPPTSSIITEVMDNLKATNPDAVARFNLNEKSKIFADIVKREVLAQTTKPPVDTKPPLGAPDAM